MSTSTGQDYTDLESGDHPLHYQAPIYPSTSPTVDTINNLPSSDNLDENQQPILMPKFTPTIIGTETREEEEENQSILFDNKFTVYEIKLVNSNTQEVHYLFRRFNEFITLKNKLLEKYPNLNLDVLLELPKMGWFWNDKLSKEVIEERKKYLLNFLNVITTDPNLASDENVLEFLQCDLHMLEKALSFFRSKLYNYQQRKEIKEKEEFIKSQEMVKVLTRKRSESLSQMKKDLNK